MKQTKLRTNCLFDISPQCTSFGTEYDLFKYYCHEYEFRSINRYANDNAGIEDDDNDDDYGVITVIKTVNK